MWDHIFPCIIMTKTVNYLEIILTKNNRKYRGMSLTVLLKYTKNFQLLEKSAIFLDGKSSIMKKSILLKLISYSFH